MSEDPYEAGMTVRREVLGDAHVDRALDRPHRSPRPSRSSSRDTPGVRSGHGRGSTGAAAA